MFSCIKKIIPRPVKNIRHFFYAWWGAVKYKHPSRELYVIGVTGTSGKSSTVFLLRQLLEFAGYTVGSLSTIEFSIAGENMLNNKKMTMLGKMEIQRFLRQMVDKGCDVAIVETTSEGRLQHRHRWIEYDMIVLTNLYPEHLEAHGGFEKYKQAKIDIFSYVAHLPRRQKGRGKMPPKKIAVVNGDTAYAEEFLLPAFDERIVFKKSSSVRMDKQGLHLSLFDKKVDIPMYGLHNAMNIQCIATIAKALGIDESVMIEAMKTFRGVPGRIESIEEAKPFGLQAIVDYAFEPVAMKALYTVVTVLQPKRIIHVFGSTGGGRDRERRFTVGTFVGEHADICIITDEDPYDDDPIAIMNDVASAVEKTGKKEGKDLFFVPDRGAAIQKAIGIAEKGDLILVTGKGSEQAMVIKGKLIPWDDREAVRSALRAK